MAVARRKSATSAYTLAPGNIQGVVQGNLVRPEHNNSVRLTKLIYAAREGDNRGAATRVPRFLFDPTRIT
jgi:hypothetical protein